ncbi:MAG TPA: T9SS type A sorting domain-containing protein [Chitinophagaceae bacterium]|nr:T9SS type A sorting domain-containing protein [Chitinophagaceae bacterium]
MKKSVLCVVLAFGYILANAQASCPVVEQSTFHFVDQANPTSKKISFTYYNPTNGNKSIVVVIKVKNVVVINDIIDASGNKNQDRTYTSAAFTFQNLSDVSVEITPHSSGNGGGSACSATLRSIGGASLPVTFGSFSASRNHSAVVLKWETLTESNNTGFNVERYNNATGTWESLAFVASLSSNGNSSIKLTYQYTDNNDSRSITQYRIKQTDFDGRSSYSEIRAVQGQDQTAKTVVFPNPSSNGTVTVVYPDASARTIMLFDMTGRAVKEWKNYSANSLQIDNLTPGMYNLRSAGAQNNNAFTEKIIIGNL